MFNSCMILIPLFKSLFLPCSIEFDRDDELFATAGVSRRIKIFEFSSVSACCIKFDGAVCSSGRHSVLICFSNICRVGFLIEPQQHCRLNAISFYLVAKFFLCLARNVFR